VNLKCVRFFSYSFLTCVLHDAMLRIEVNLECRDIRCGEWFIPTKGKKEIVFRVRNPW